LLNGDGSADIRFLEATIGPDNIPSRSLFLGLSQSLGAECSMSSRYGSELFPGPESHDDELLFRIGPIGRARTLTDQPLRMEEMGQ
jgi:L-2,4-diaminobutyric acid acetyltransferase